MKKLDAWTEILLEANDAYLEALHALSAALVDQGASGAMLDEQTTQRSAIVPTCEGCEHRTRIKVYFPESGQTVEEVLAVVERAVRQTREIYEGFDARILRIHTIGNGNWAEEWKAYFAPQRVSQRIVVAPPWNIPGIPSDAILILIEPGRAFGTGQHPSTALCLEFLDAIALNQGSLPVSFLDVGCGSGILCMAAYKLGAREILGVDLDQDVAGEAVRNFTLNDLENQITLVTGPPQCIRTDFDIVAANLDSRLLQQSVQCLTKRVKKDGGLILSGILEEEVPEIRLLYQDAGFYAQDERAKEEWGALYLRRKAGKK